MSSFAASYKTLKSPHTHVPLYSEGEHIKVATLTSRLFCLVRATCAAFLARLRLARPLLLFFLPRFYCCCSIAVRTLWLNLSARCLSWFTGRFNHPTPSDSTPSSRLWCTPTQCAALPFLSGLSPLRSPLLHNPGVHAGALGFNLMLLPKLDRREIPRSRDRGTTIDQTQAPCQYEARARVSVFVEWSLRVIRPLADLGPPRQGQAMGAVHSALYIIWVFRERAFQLVVELTGVPLDAHPECTGPPGTIDRNVPRFIHDTPDICISLIPSGLTHTQRLNNVFIASGKQRK